MATREAGGDTATDILDVAERLVQERGFNGFSYADVAAELHLTKPALHYHFPGKAELGEALIDRYASRFASALDGIDHRAGKPRERLAAYADLYVEVLKQHRMCLCGMLAAELYTLPETMRARVRDFFRANEEWLERVLDQGRQDGSLHFGGGAAGAAQALVGALEGAMLVARVHGDPARLRGAADHLLSGLSPDT